MTQLEMLQQVARAFERGEVESVAHHLHPEFVFVPRRAPVEGDFVGIEGMRRFFRDNEESFERFEPRFDLFEEHGDRILALGRLRVRGKGSGADTTVAIASVATFRDGKLVRVEDFGEESRARAQL